MTSISVYFVMLLIPLLEATECSRCNCGEFPYTSECCELKHTAEELDIGERMCGTKGYTFHNTTEKCYKFHLACSNWSRADLICSHEGGNLAIINDEAEAEVIRYLFTKVPTIGGSYLSGAPHEDKAFYVGIRYLEGFKWTTVDGVSLSKSGYDKWGYGEPNNASTHGEYCITVLPNARLYDDSCHLNISFICEKEVKRGNGTKEFKDGLTNVASLNMILKTYLSICLITIYIF